MDEDIEEMSDLERESDWARAYLEETELYLVNTAPNRGSGEEGPTMQSGSDRQGEGTNLREAMNQQRDKLNYNAIGVDRVVDSTYSRKRVNPAGEQVTPVDAPPSTRKDELEEPTRPSSPFLPNPSTTAAVSVTPDTATGTAERGEVETILRLLQRLRAIADRMAEREGL